MASPPAETERVEGYAWLHTDHGGLVAWRLQSNLLDPPDVTWSPKDWWGFLVECRWERIKWMKRSGWWGKL